ncbi:dehydrogenase [Phaeovibrio sulfidiphilus]|uniref:Dehydrogenase n=1 Tax=Phaeovibrio sulfidiphilus TaxID=1220600 RepID=A0A8J6YNM9_9PROT|nr:dehydrogenase [Phaeovibrio sulfidiphilus]MBE1237880.1 dehydrogenase [Phaeovibrio sulfidiphilus]
MIQGRESLGRPGIRSTCVRARAPLRLGLAGGGTDVSPYCDLYGGAVMNATIDRFIYSSVRLIEPGQVRFVSQDLGVSETLEAAHPVPAVGPLALLKAIYNRIVRDYCDGEPLPLEIATYSEAPAGSGLGSSSTLVVSVVQALADLLALPLGEYDVASLAYTIERKDLGLAGGRQDQYAASFGGFNYMEFSANDAVIVNPLRIRPEVIAEMTLQTILCFTGVSRQSAEIINEQTANVKKGAEKSVEAMHALKQTAVEMKNALLKGDIARVCATLQAGWESKKDMASSISNAHIEEAMHTGLSAGASAGKVSGAGGGGFIMFFVPFEHRRSVLAALGARGFRTETIQYTKEGVTSWRV